MKERVILHCDINHCYAQIEEMMFPKLREVPMAVGGHEDKRHGIILAKNDLCRPFKLRTGESLREAYKKCPNLLIVHPHYNEYMYYTSKVKDIYREYSDKVESFGLDEAWVDISESIPLYGTKEQIASEIQRRVLEEVGLTISIGVSYNKIFAKLGSDLIKPSGLVYITKDNYQEIVWKRPIDELLYVGRSTEIKLKAYGIMTIGDLANAKPDFLNSKLGKMGNVLYWFANGLDDSEVDGIIEEEKVKSVGNSITTVHDINNCEEAKLVFLVLAESIATRLREIDMAGSVVSISIRTVELTGFIRQVKISEPTNIVSVIVKYAMQLLHDNVDFKLPLRSIGISMSQLKPDHNYFQFNLFEDTNKLIREKDLDKTIGMIKEKYGAEAIKRCSLLIDRELTDFNPLSDNIIHPVGYF